MKANSFRMMFVVFLCAVAAIFSAASSCKKQDTAPKDPVPVQENHQKKQAPLPDKVLSKSNLGWPIVDEIVDKRELYFSVVGLQKYPGAEFYNEEYFRSLKKRKETILTWSKENKPVIVFVGQIHISSTGETVTEEKYERIQMVQDWSFDKVKEQSDATVITFEDSGSDERVTVDTMVYNLRRETQIMAKQYPQLLNLTDKDFEQIVLNDQQASVRLVREKNSPPIYFGEEWPNRMELRVLMNLNSMLTEDNKEITKDFVFNFNRLRSEIILIRTLEFLKKLNGHKGVILQGYMHGQDIKGFEDEYGVKVELVMPKVAPAP